MKVTNSHHFSKGVVLEIEDGKLKWTVDRTSQRYKYGTIRLEQGDGIAVLDPSGSPESFVHLLNIMFEFTGCLPHGLHIRKENQTGDDFMTSAEEHQQVIDLIYKTPLGRKVRLVSFDRECDCVKSECWNNCPDSKIINLQVFSLAKTYGDLFKSFGEEIESEGITHYEYPDSVWLSLSHISNLHPAMSLIKETEGYEDDVLYIQFYYGR